MIADANKLYVLHTDASDYAMGAVLMQSDENGDLHPIAYASKTFNDAQKNYDTTDREALAVVWALEHFNTYCEGHKYTLITDHQALAYIHSNKDSKKRIHRLALKLANYDVKLFYKPGKENHMADLLSRDFMQKKSDIVKNVGVKSNSAKNDENNVLPVLFQGAHLTKKKRNKSSKIEYEVEKILDRRKIEGRDDEYEYKVRWKGYGEEDDTWEPLVNLQHAIKLIVDYEKKRKKKISKMNENEAEKKTSKFLPKIRVCDTCAKSFVNDSAYYIHNYHEHGVAVPAAVLSHMDLTSNVSVFKSLQESEPQFRAIYNSNFGANDYSFLDKKEKRMLDQHEFITSGNDLLYCVEIPTSRTRSKIRTQLRLCVPKTERLRILNKYHNENAHSGISRLYDKLCDKVWWPSMLRDVVSYVRCCESCQKSKGNINNIKTRPMGLPTRPWSHIHFDHVGPFPCSDGGNVYILTVIDRFTRYAEAFALTEDQLTTDATAKILVEKIICRYGLPDVMISDRGPVVVGMVLNQIFKILGIRRAKTSAHHAQSNGVVEIFNKTLKTSLKIWAKENQKDWDEYLPFALFAYNTAFHSLLRETPYYLNHGRQAKDITDDLSETDYYMNASIHGYAKELADRLFKTHHRVRELLESVNEKREIEIESENCVKFEIGDQVLLYDPTTPSGVSRKLVKRWLGPYAVIEKHSDVVYTIMRDDPHQSQKVNVKRLRLFKDFIDIKISDDEETALDIAIREVSALSDEILSLQERKQLISATHNIDEEKLQESINEQQNQSSENVNINSLVIKNGVSYVSVHEQLYWC
jgi:transposase InsO family protein